MKPVHEGDVRLVDHRARTYPARDERTLWPDEPIVHHDANAAGGRDLVAGDVHGHFDTLVHALDALAFDPRRDRLFSVGDLIDRGPGSGAAVEWLEGKRIAAVRGNHDQSMVDALALDRGRLRMSGRSGLWTEIGGRWWYDGIDGFDSEHALSERCRRWLTAFRRVPFLRTIETDAGRVGIVHTFGFTNDWPGLEVRIRSLWQKVRDGAGWEDTWDDNRALHHETLWARPAIECEEREDEGLPRPVTGIALVLIGHTPAARPRWTRHNVLCIDTGVHVPEFGHLTIAEVQTGTARLHRFARVEP